MPPEATPSAHPGSPAATSPPLYINGRFLVQPLSGVQRFATEISAALASLLADTGAPPPIMLVPHLPDRALRPSDIPLRVVGRHSGQLWEQLELPRHARDGVLLNLGNTAPLRGGRQLLVIHDAGVYESPDAYSWKFRAWYKFLQTRLVRGSTGIVTVSQFSRREIVRFLGAAADQVAVIPEGADHMQHLVPDQGVLARHAIMPGRFVIAVGNLSRHKNLASLHATAAALATRGIDLVITGGLDSGVFAAGQSTLPTPAKYVGRVSDQELRALYDAAACFVFPSLYEGFGLPAVEAMMCGCPVVAADIPALREVCGEAALFCNPADADDIARQVCRVIDEPATREALITAMPAHIADYTWRAAARALLQATDRLRAAA
jgi:glycosyltransferase involved in cell wall biosynthesis